MALVLPARYVLIAPLGEGSTGSVFHVRDCARDIDVALKVAREQAPSRQNNLLLFRREFRWLMQIQHPNCCKGYEFDVLPDGRPYFTMELVHGTGLDQVGVLDGPRAIGMMAQLLAALGAVHAQGLVHRDLKPANIRLTPEGLVKLTDFGLVELAGRAGAPISGTLAYLAPEIIKRGPVDRRADLYALGAVIYELLTGQPPFRGQKASDVLQAHIRETPVRPSKRVSNLPGHLDLIVSKLLEKDPLDRFQNAYEVLAALNLPIPDQFTSNLLSAPLVGREHEQQALNERLHQVTQGASGGVVLLHGPLGLGKSRLLDDIRFAADLARVPVLSAAGHEQDPAPYTVVTALLHAVWRQWGSAEELLTTDAHAPWISVLARLTPIPGIEPAEELDPTGEKRRLQTALTTLLSVLAEKTGVLVMIDDWHWVEPFSRELLMQVMRNMGARPAVFVLASSYPPEGNPDWVKIVSNVPVMPLDELGVRALVASMLGEPEPEPEFIAQVARVSEGVPFVIAGLLEELVTRGALAMTRGRWDTAISLPPNLLPRKLLSLMATKLTRLPPEAQELAHLAAVYGRDADADLLQSASGLADEQLLASLETLERDGVFQRDSRGTYRFSQDPFKEHVYANLPGDVLGALHLRVGQALESTLERPEASEHLPQTALFAALAHHFQQGGDTARTAHYGLKAGLANLELQALAPADRWLRAGLAAYLELKATGQGQPQEHLRYLQAIAQVRSALGSNHAAREALREAQKLLSADDSLRDQAEILTELARIQRLLAEWPDALILGRAARALWEEQGDAKGLALATLGLSRTHLFQGDVADAIARGEEAIRCARKTQDRRLLAECLAHLGNVFITQELNRSRDGLGCLEEAMTILPTLGDPGSLRDGYMLLGNAQQSLGHFTAAAHAFAEAFTLSETLGTPAGSVAALASQALVSLSQGSYPEALRQAREAQQRAIPMQNTYVLGLGVAVEALAQAALGQAVTAVPLVQRALTLGREVRHRFLEVMANQAAAELYEFMGNAKETTRHTEVLERLLNDNPRSGAAQRLWILKAELALLLNDNETAAVCLEHAASMGSPTADTRLRLWKTEVRLYLRREEWPALKALAQKALALAEELEVLPSVAELRGTLGEWALATGSPEARAHFTAMLAAADRMGTPTDQALALFGLAAARPYQAESPSLAQRAREHMLAVVYGLEEPERRQFLARIERARVMEGNYIAFSLPRTVQRGSGPLLGLASDTLADLWHQRKRPDT